MALAEMVDRRTFNELLFASYAGMSEDRMVLLAEEAFDNVHASVTLPSSQGLIEKSRAAGHDVVLVSGALEIVLEHAARYLGAQR